MSRRLACRVLAVVLLATIAAPVGAQPSMWSATFRVFVRGADVGAEEVTVLQSADGWVLRGTGGLTFPYDLNIRFWEARYDPSWRPRELSLDLAVKGEARTLHTTFSGTSAASEIGQGDKTSRKTDPVAADTVVLSNLVFGTYEALAARLAISRPGTSLRAFMAPQAELEVRAVRFSDETIQVAKRAIAARRWLVTFVNPGGPLDIDVWTEGDRLLRLDIPSQMISVVREDIATVAARLVTAARPNDEQVMIPANGFSLAATVSKPAGEAAGRLPAVILVSGSALTDRDEIVASIPIFAQLAGALADAGFVVIRYDKRGVGQSGGRLDIVTLGDFAEDARAVVRWAAGRKDVDNRHIALAGYGEGAWVAMQVASQEDRVSALVSIAGASVPGSELVLEQQRHGFERGSMSTAQRQEAIERQKQIIQAAISGKGWEGLPAEIRQRADTPWYQSYLVFDVPRVMSRTRQPVLVVQGDLDREIAAHHGDRLAELARLRSKGRGADLVHLPGINHLLAQATTGETDEYGRLQTRSISPGVAQEISAWLQRTFAPPAPGK